MIKGSFHDTFNVNVGFMFDSEIFLNFRRERFSSQWFKYLVFL